MKIKINIYTSFYKKMLQRHKQENDIYIQVSRSLFMPIKGVDNVSMSSMIDINLGDCFGMFADTLEEYEQIITSDDYKQNIEDLRSIFTLESMGITEDEVQAEYDKMSEKEKEQAKLIGFTDQECNFNFYLLCFEDLNSCYTEKDEKKYPDCKAGTKKTCHRTILAKVLNDRYNLGVKEL